MSMSAKDRGRLQVSVDVGVCVRVGAALAAAAVVIGTAGSARAHGDIDKPDTPAPAAPAAPAPPPATPPPPAPAPEGAAAGAEPGAEREVEKKEEEEEKGTLGLDLVMGWGKVPFAVQNLPGAGSPAVTYTRADAVPSNVQSFILGGSVEVINNLDVGLRVPFTFAGFSPDGSAARSTTGVGNLELEGEYELELSEHLMLTGALGLALPTAQGDEIPPDLMNANANSVDATAFDRFSLSRAAASARGYEDNALFEPDRFGIIPKIGALYRLRGLSVEPYVKVENLVATSSKLDEKYVGELVAAVRVGYWVHKQFELALRGWVNVGYAGSDEDKQTAAMLEPDLVLRFGPVRPYAGVLVPLAGPPSDNGFVGVRVGLAGSF